MDFEISAHPWELNKFAMGESLLGALGLWFSCLFMLLACFLQGTLQEEMVQEKAVRWAETHVDSLLTQQLKKPDPLNGSRQGTSKKEQALDWRMSYCKTHK